MQSFRKRRWLFGIVAGILLANSFWWADRICAAATGLIESRYSILYRGVRVGDLQTVCSTVPRNEKTALKFESITNVDANLLVYAYRLQTREETIVADEGTVHYQRTTTENGDKTEVEGRLERGRFLLEISENGKHRSMVVKRASYDFTTMECPEVRMKREGEEMTARLLDLETLTVVVRKYHWVKNEDVEVEGRRIRCRVVDFEDPNKQCRRWIKPDGMGVIIARQEGKGKGGSYSLRITHLKNGG